MINSFKYGFMRNKTIYFITLWILLCLHIYNCKAQFIDKYINIYTGYVNGHFYGKEVINETGYISPSLYSNFEDLNGISIKALYNGHKYFSFGLSTEFLNGSNWYYDGRSNYSGAGIKIRSLSPVLQFHNKFLKDGVFNKLKIFIEISPSFGTSVLTLKNPLFDIQGENITVAQPMESSDAFYGIKGGAGLEFVFSKLFGVYITYSLQYDWVNSKLYNDKQFSSTQLDFGIFMRFIRDKRYFY